MVEAAVADVIGPAVAADDPDAFLDQRVGQAEQVAGLAGVGTGQLLLQQLDAGALLEDAGLGGLVGVEQGLRKVFAD